MGEVEGGGWRVAQRRDFHRAKGAQHDSRKEGAPWRRRGGGGRETMGPGGGRRTRHCVGIGLMEGGEGRGLWVRLCRCHPSLCV